MDRGAMVNVGPGSPLDRLSDDILLRILAEGACIVAEGAWNVEDHPRDRVWDGFGDMRKLCQLRTVCHRFDDLVMGVENIVWRLNPAAVLAPSAHRFLQQCKKLKGLRLIMGRNSFAQSDVYAIPDSFWLAISRVTPDLEEFEILGGMQNRLNLPDGQMHEVFKTMAMCPRLASLKLERCDAQLTQSLSPRHKLNSIVNLHISTIDLTDLGVSSILEACQQLESLTLSSITGLTTPVLASKCLKMLVIQQQRPLMNTLKIVAPDLRCLSASGMTMLTVGAPNLEELVLGNTCAIVRESTWKVTGLKVGDGPRNLNQLVEIFALCKDARKVTVLHPFQPDVSGDLVALSWLLQHLEHLEYLEIPSDLAMRINIDTGGAVPMSLSLPKLKKLKVSFEKLRRQFELCLELCRIAPQLVDLCIDLTNLLGRNRADSVVMRLLELQRQYPLIKLLVNWPTVLQ